MLVLLLRRYGSRENFSLRKSICLLQEIHHPNSGYATVIHEGGYKYFPHKESFWLFTLNCSLYRDKFSGILFVIFESCKWMPTWLRNSICSFYTWPQPWLLVTWKFWLSVLETELQWASRAWHAAALQLQSPQGTGVGHSQWKVTS